MQPEAEAASAASKGKWSASDIQAALSQINLARPKGSAEADEHQAESIAFDPIYDDPTIGFGRAVVVVAAAAVCVKSQGPCS